MPHWWMNDYWNRGDEIKPMIEKKKYVKSEMTKIAIFNPTSPCIFSPGKK